MCPDEKGEWQELLKNWGRWAGGGLEDPALVHYYTVSPMFQNAPFVRKGLKSAPPTDNELAEMIERAMLALRERDREAFRLLRARYAYNTSQAILAERWCVSRQTLQRMLDHATELLAECFRAGQSTMS